MVVSPDTTIKFILGSKPRDNNDRPDLLSTLIAAIRMSSNSSSIDDLALCIFGLLSVVALDAKGGASLRRLDVDALAIDVVRDYSDSPQVHELAFTLLHNMMADVERGCHGWRVSDLTKVILDSIEEHTDEEILQANAIQLLRVISRGTCLAKSLVRNERGRRILAMANANFPDSCKELVDSLLHDE